MFDNLKKLAQSKQFQDSLKNEKVEIERSGIKLVMRGDFSVEEIIINSELSKEELENTLKDCFNEAIKEIQMKMAGKMMGGLF